MWKVQRRCRRGAEDERQVAPWGCVDILYSPSMVLNPIRVPSLECCGETDADGIEQWASSGPKDLILGKIFPSVILTQFWRPRSAPGEPELETPNKGSSPYFHLSIYSGSLALSVGSINSIPTYMTIVLKSQE